MTLLRLSPVAATYPSRMRTCRSSSGSKRTSLVLIAERDNDELMLVESDDEHAIDYGNYYSCRVPGFVWVRQANDASPENQNAGKPEDVDLCGSAPATGRVQCAGNRIGKRPTQRKSRFRMLGGISPVVRKQPASPEFARQTNCRSNRQRTSSQNQNRGPAETDSIQRKTGRREVVHELGCFLLVVTKNIRAKDLFAERDFFLPLLCIFWRYTTAAVFNVRDCCVGNAKYFTQLSLGKIIGFSIRADRMFFHHATYRSSRNLMLQQVAHENAKLRIVAK